MAGIELDRVSTLELTRSRPIALLDRSYSRISNQQMPKSCALTCKLGPRQASNGLEQTKQIHA